MGSLALGTTTLPVALVLGAMAPFVGGVIKALVDVTPLREALTTDEVKNAAWIVAAVLTAAVAGTYGLPVSAASAFNLMVLSLSGKGFVENAFQYFENPVAKSPQRAKQDFSTLKVIMTGLMTLNAPLFKTSMVAAFVFAHISITFAERMLVDVKALDRALHPVEVTPEQDTHRLRRAHRRLDREQSQSVVSLRTELENRGKKDVVTAIRDWAAKQARGEQRFVRGVLRAVVEVDDIEKAETWLAGQEVQAVSDSGRQALINSLREAIANREAWQNAEAAAFAWCEGDTGARGDFYVELTTVLQSSNNFKRAEKLDLKRATAPRLGAALSGIPATAVVLSAVTPFAVTPLVGVGLGVAAAVQAIGLALVF